VCRPFFFRGVVCFSSRRPDQTKNPTNTNQADRSQLHQITTLSNDTSHNQNKTKTKIPKKKHQNTKTPKHQNSDGIARWIKKKTGPAAATLADAAALTAAEKDAAVLVVGYFKDLKGAEYEAFTKAAQKTEDAVFAQTTDAAAAKAAGISGGPPGFSVVANHPNEDRATAPGGKKVTAEAVEALLKANKLPVVVPFNDENSSKIFGSGIEKQVLLVAKSGDLDHKAGGKSAKAFRAAAAGFRGKLTFVAVDVESKSAAPVTNFFGVKAEVGRSFVFRFLFFVFCFLLCGGVSAFGCACWFCRGVCARRLSLSRALRRVMPHRNNTTAPLSPSRAAGLVPPPPPKNKKPPPKQPPPPQHPNTPSPTKQPKTTGRPHAARLRDVGQQKVQVRGRPHL